MTVSSVLLCWAVGFLVVVLNSRRLSWTEETARTDGVFLVYQMLNEALAPTRAERLGRLRPHFSVDFALISLDEVERRVGRRAHPGERIWHKASEPREWYFVVFEDGQGALAAGPVNPAVPVGFLPIGIVLAIVGLPLLAGLLALRVERELTKVERASQALADGELSARVHNPRGPSNELAASFNAMAERVERLVRSRDELVQAVSHELGSPLSRLRFHLELLENPTESRREERLRAMTRELDALDELVAELLGYVQSDEHSLAPTAFDPKQSLTDLAELARLEIPQDRMLEVDLELPPVVRIYADQRLFLRAVENVLRNAVRYARSKVVLEVSEDQEHVWVAIHDDGPGIPKELREKVTIPFFRLEADRARRTGGVGLGLAIVSRIAHRHGGRLAIDTSSLGGATVATLWPKRNDALER